MSWNLCLPCVCMCVCAAVCSCCLLQVVYTAPRLCWPPTLRSKPSTYLCCSPTPHLTSRFPACDSLYRYQGLREPLLGTTQLLYCLFLSSLQPLPPPAGLATPPPGLGTCPALNSVDLGGGSCRPDGSPASSDAVLAGFGILRFVVHSCGLHYITLSPLLLRVSLGCCGWLKACVGALLTDQPVKRHACLLMLMLHCS